MSQDGNQKRPLWVTALVLLVTAVLVFHFLAVWLYLTPTNPLKMTLWQPLHAYVHPLFAQNWQLFAPTPIAHDELMHIKIRWREAGNNRVWETEWLDVATPIYRRIQRSRVGPFSKLARPYTGVKEAIDFVDPIAEALRQSAIQKHRAWWEQSVRRNPPRDSAARAQALRMLLTGIDTLEQLTASESAQRRMGREMAYRLASANARQAIGPRGDVLAINIRFVLYEFPRFSQREDPNAIGRSANSAALGWEPPRANVLLP